MPNYEYQAIGPQEERVSGAIEAGSATEAIATLEGRGLRLLSVHVAEPISASASDGKLAEPPDVGPLAVPIARVLARRDGLAQALLAYAADGAPASLRAGVQRLAGAIKAQDSQALESCVARWPAIAIPLLGAAGEGIAGASENTSVAEIVSRFDERVRTAADLKRSRRWRIAYPASLVGIGLLVLMILSLTAAPTYRSLYEDFDLVIPTNTWLILAAMDALTDGSAWVGLGAAVATYYGIRRAGRLLPVGWLRFLEMLAPFRLGRSLRISELAESTASLIQGGLSRGDAVRIAATATGRRTVADSAHRLAHKLDQNPEDINPSGEWSLTPPVALALTADISESSRSRLLREIALCHSDVASLRRPFASGYMGPITLLLVGLFVLFISWSLMHPMVKLIECLT